MYTIKQASRLTGVPETSLRAWERRYGVVSPRRNDAGYRVYDAESLTSLMAMRQLIDAGWSAAEAARSVRSGTAPPVSAAPSPPIPLEGTPAVDYMQQFLRGAAMMDTTAIEQSLDGGFTLGTFEHVADNWLFPTLEALGEGWARGEIDVAGEHAASHAVHRRLSAALSAAGSRARGPAVVVGLPPGSHHELGALAFATAIRRRGLHVLYLGADVPVTSWQKAVERHAARAAVLAAVTETDRSAAATVAEHLLASDPTLLVASGGAAGEHLTTGVHTLAPAIAAAARELDGLLHGDNPD